MATPLPDPPSLVTSENNLATPSQTLPAFRSPPHNFEAEKALLGAIFANNNAYDRVSDFLRPRHFADPVHGQNLRGHLQID